MAMAAGWKVDDSLPESSLDWGKMSTLMKESITRRIRAHAEGLATKLILNLDRPWTVSHTGIEELSSARVDLIASRFESFCNEWKSGRDPLSSVAEMAMHPAYQKIIGMGPDAIPFILEELERELDHWFWALKAISREDPVPESSPWNPSEMRDYWREWGKGWTGLVHI